MNKVKRLAPGLSKADLDSLVYGLDTTEDRFGLSDAEHKLRDRLRACHDSFDEYYEQFIIGKKIEGL